MTTIIVIIIGFLIIVELATTMTLGFKFIHDKSLDLLEQEIKTHNSIGGTIIHLSWNGPMKGRYITSTCRSPLSCYYISTEYGNYRVPWFSKSAKIIKAAYKSHIQVSF